METRSVVIANNGEVFRDFLSRKVDSYARSQLIYSEQRLGDRALLWLEDSKLVITSYPVHHLEYVRKKLGYQNTILSWPTSPSYSLCSDILEDQRLFEQIIEYGNGSDILQIVPYATTPEFLTLIDKLAPRIQATIDLPESPLKENLWVRDYADTKIGFRSLVSDTLAQLDIMLPDGYIASNAEEACQIVSWFGHQNLSCLVKANDGENGIGNMIIHPTEFPSFESLFKHIASFDFFQEQLLVVERYISSEKKNSPSIEFFVPPTSGGTPSMTYLSNQIFRGFNNFCGIEINSYLYEEPWYHKAKQMGARIANKLQALGYIGHFDLDIVVDDFGQPFPVEVNTRRTGGTHVHEFAKFLFGPQYANKFVLLSDDAIPSPGVSTFEDLLERLDGILFPIKNQPDGIVPTVTSSLSHGLFGCIIVALSQSEAWELHRDVVHRLTT